MQKILPVALLLLLSPLCFAASYPSLPRDTIYVRQQLSAIKMHDLQKMAQRKFSLKEKMIIKMVQKLEKRQSPARVPDKDGNLSFLAALGLMALYGSWLLFINSAAFPVISPIVLSLIFLLAIAALWLGLRSRKKRGWRFKNSFGVIIGGLAIALGVFVGIVNLFRG